MTAVLACTDVTVTAGGARLLDRVSVDLLPGELLAVVGPNGAGKTTLVRVLAGDQRPDGGSVTLDGRPLADHRGHELALRRAVLPQQTVIAFPFPAAEVVRMGRFPHRSRATAAEDDRAVALAMARCGVAHLAERRFPTLSGGEQARVCLARVLAQDTGVLLLDEPTASLDLSHQQAVLRIARTLASEGRAVLIVLHDLNLAAAHTDRLVLLDRGRVAASGPPAHALDAALLSRVYGHPVLVTRHPARDCPLVLAR
jgi:iron complex transport system ATP-binding protein